MHLLPDTAGALPVQLRAAPVPAQELRLRLRIRSMSQAPAQLDLTLYLTVPVIDSPVGLRAELQLLRVRDRDTASFTVPSTTPAVSGSLWSVSPAAIRSWSCRSASSRRCWRSPGQSGSVRVAATGARTGARPRGHPSAHRHRARRRPSDRHSSCRLCNGPPSVSRGCSAG